MVDYLNFVKNAGLGSFWEGQNQADKLRTSALNQMLTEAQTEASRGAEARNQALHPLEMQSRQATTSEVLARTKKSEFEQTKAQEQEQRDRTDRFFAYMQTHDDPVGAVAYSGVPDTFAQKFLSMPPEVRNKMYAAMAERKAMPKKADAAAEAAGKQPYELERIKEQANRQLQVQEAMTNRALALEELRARGKAEAAKISAELRNKPVTSAQRLADLRQQQEDILRKIRSLPKGDPQIQVLSAAAQELQGYIELNAADVQAGRYSPQPAYNVPGAPQPQAPKPGDYNDMLRNLGIPEMPPGAVRPKQ
jgi:hypothetical protein